MIFVYGTDAKKRISQLGAKEIIEFLEEVPQKHRAAIFSVLPAVPSFRKNQPAELKKRIEKLGTNLAHAFEASHRATERDWSALAACRTSWIIKLQTTHELPLQEWYNINY